MKRNETVELTTPIMRGDQVIEKITIQEPSSGAMRGLAISDILRMDEDAVRDLLPRVSNIQAPEFNTLGAYDRFSICKTVISFFTKPPMKSVVFTQENKGNSGDEKSNG